MFSISILAVAIIVLLIVYIIGENKKRHPNYPPGPPSLPIWGAYWFLLRENFRYPFKALVSLHKKYKSDVIGFFLGPYSTVSCYKYELVKELLNRDEFVGRMDTVIIRNRGRGNLFGIFFTDGPFWKDQRWFSLRNMRDFGFGRREELMEEITAQEVRYLIDFFTSNPKKCDADICTEKGVVLMPDVIFGPAVNSVHQVLSATHFENYAELREVARAATRFLQSIDSTGNCITVTPWLRFFGADYFGWNSSFRDTEVVFEFSRKIIKEHKDTFIEGHPRDFIDMYLSEMNYLQEHNKTNTSFTETQLVYTITDYMFPSPVGVGHTLSYIFASIILQPEIQDKIHEEIVRVVGRGRLPTLDDRKNLHYTEATLRESMRKDTLVPLSLSRRCTKDTTFGGYFIPKDTNMMPNLWAMHNDPEFWGDPENFRPERFLEADGTLTKKDRSLPFGAGKRLCAGETFARNTLFLFLAGIMQNFSLKMAEGKSKSKFVPDDLKNGITLTTKDFWIEAIPRP